MSVLDNIAIRKLLPHRYPLLLVDQVIEFIPQKSITAIKNVTCNEPFFAGHFPTLPVMPGVLVVEALAQTAGILILQSETELVEHRDLFYLAGVDKARFKRKITPGDQLVLHAEVMRHRLDLWKFQCTATVNGEVACTAEIMNIKGSESY